MCDQGVMSMTIASDFEFAREIPLKMSGPHCTLKISWSRFFG